MGEKGIKAVIGIVPVIIIVLNLTGCATTGGGSKEMQIKQLQMHVDELERQLEVKNEQIYDLQNKTAKSKEVKNTAKTAAEKPKTSTCTLKNIQAALKNANLYQGSVDGKIGKNTRKAIKEFQKANGLLADGVVGEKTWSKLQEYL
ncbi:MAG: peptidoglycan-binding domain-containing protein [Candidatus Omnitrophota bacterium]